VVGQVVGLHFSHSCCLFFCICIYRYSKPIIFDVLVHTILTYIYIYMLLNCTYRNNNTNTPFFFVDGHRMWTKAYMNDDNIQMLIFLIIFFFSINITNGINQNTINLPLDNQSLPIENLLNEQYDNRQMTSNRTPSIRPWKKSNSIEMLKKMIGNRQRSATTSRTLPSTTITSTLHVSRISLP
jgi:hypothetical protein